MTNYLKVFYFLVEAKKEMECKNNLYENMYAFSIAIYFRDILQIIQTKLHSIFKPRNFLRNCFEIFSEENRDSYSCTHSRVSPGLKEEFHCLVHTQTHILCKEEWLLQVPVKVANSTFKNLVCAVVDDNFCKCVFKENTSLHTDTNKSISYTHTHSPPLPLVLGRESWQDLFLTIFLKISLPIFFLKLSPSLRKCTQVKLGRHLCNVFILRREYAYPDQTHICISIYPPFAYF